MKINTEQRLCFLIRISSVNVTKSAVYCGFGHLLNKSLKEKFSFFFVQYDLFVRKSNSRQTDKKKTIIL